MRRMDRFSEPFSATGGIAAPGVLNPLGRPDIEPLEVLVREAVQNCWDAKRRDVGSIRIEIGRAVLEDERYVALKDLILTDPPPGLPLSAELRPSMTTLHFADYGTDGLGGPTRADAPGSPRDFVDFLRNIGQPPDKDLGGGSFGYGKAAFYIASRARTILVDTLCRNMNGALERRFMGCSLGEPFEVDGRPYTGRHWWGRSSAGMVEPLVGDEAALAATLLGLPDRRDSGDLGTTVVVVAPGVAPDAEDEIDYTMEFIAEALAWNFWPRMIDTPGGRQHTMSFRLFDNGRRVRLPDPRTHFRLRGFVEAMDALRMEPDGADEDFVIDRSIACLRPAQQLGRLIIQKGPVAPVETLGRAVPQGAKLMSDSVHHVALMRNAELIVRYLPGPTPLTGRFGYSGVFMCAVDVDEAFRQSETPTHDDWVHTALPKGRHKTFVKVALDRISDVCREAAGYDPTLSGASAGTGIPLGEFADALAALMPGFDGPGARRRAGRKSKPKPRAKRRAVEPPASSDPVDGVWVEGAGGSRGEEATDSAPVDNASPDLTRDKTERSKPLPQARSKGDPGLAITDAGPVARFPFELRTRGNRVRLAAVVQVMANDGAQVENDVPLGAELPSPTCWIDPSGSRHETTEVLIGPEDADGEWAVEVPLSEEAMMRVVVTPSRV